MHVGVTHATTGGGTLCVTSIGIVHEPCMFMLTLGQEQILVGARLIGILPGNTSVDRGLQACRCCLSLLRNPCVVCCQFVQSDHGLAALHDGMVNRRCGL